MSVINEMRKAHRLRGDTYSSAEVIGLVGRAADEIERLREALVEISELGDVRCDEAPSIARRALITEECKCLSPATAWI